MKVEGEKVKSRMRVTERDSLMEESSVRCKEINPNHQRKQRNETK